MLKNYVRSFPVLQASDSEKVEIMRQQILHEKENQERKDIPVALNGIAYIPDYKNWQPVSSTERYDNGTLRVIVGNDIALKAIADGNTNPWPEGTIFGKIPDEHWFGGNIPGNLLSVDTIGGMTPGKLSILP